MPIFVLLCCCASSLPFIKMHPGFLLCITRQQTHHLSPSFQCKRKRYAEALLERPSSILPDCLTNEEPKHILWACSVTHNWSWQLVPPSPPPEKNRAFLGLSLKSYSTSALSVLLFQSFWLLSSLYTLGSQKRANKVICSDNSDNKEEIIFFFWDCTVLCVEAKKKKKNSK